MLTIHHVHSFDKQQFADMLSAIDRGTSTLLLKVLIELIERVKKMGLNFDELNSAVAAIQADVQNVIARLNAPDEEAQAKIDAATATLRGIDTALDAIAPDPVEPTPDAPVDWPPLTF